MKRRNKIIIGILLLSMVLCLCSCNEKEEPKAAGIVMTALPAEEDFTGSAVIKTVNSNKVIVYYCDCNAFGVTSKESGSTQLLSKHSLASMSEETYAAFDELSAAYDTFLSEYEQSENLDLWTLTADNAAYADFFGKAENIFSGCDFSVANGVKFNMAKSSVIGVDNKFEMYFGNSIYYSYADKLGAVAGLFGYTSSDTFKTYAQNIEKKYGGNTVKDVDKNRLVLDGAIYTSNGSYIFPYVVNSTVASNFAVLVIIDVKGTISVWVSSMESLGYAVDIGKETEEPISIRLYGRCKMFDTASGFYRFSYEGELTEDITYAKMKLSTTDGLSKEITIILLPEYAPKTVKNFITYVEEGFYEDTVIHRLLKGSVLQGGGYVYKNGYKVKASTSAAIEGEFASNGHPENIIGHCPGVISMARASVDSATAGFFLLCDYCKSYDGAYAAFGFMPYQEDIDFIAELGNTTETVQLGGDTKSAYPSSRRITVESVEIFNKKEIKTTEDVE